MISHSPSQSISIRNASKSVWTLLDQAMASVATTAWDTRTALSSWATSPGLGHSCRAFTPCVAPCSKKKRYNLEIEWDTKIIWIHLNNLDSWIILSHSIRLAWEMHTTRHLWAVTCFILLHLALFSGPTTWWSRCILALLVCNPVSRPFNWKTQPTIAARRTLVAELGHFETLLAFVGFCVLG